MTSSVDNKKMPTAAPAAAGPKTGLHDLGSFWRKHPEFLVGPALMSAAYAAFPALAPGLSASLAAAGWAPYGAEDTALYVGFAIMCVYATHGWYTVHVEQKAQLQSYDGKTRKMTYAERSSTMSEAAVRTVAALLTGVVYAWVPFAPATTSWPTFIAWNIGFSVYWDAHFFVVHKVVHEYPWLYKNIHKLHHTQKQPHPFTAYFVTYQSHILTEQSVVFLLAAMGVPRDVFTWIMWYGTLATYLEHGGHGVDDVKLSPLPITFGQLCTCLSPWSLVLGGESPAEHDWHHERFTTNYALSYKYLDKLFGTYHPGRVPGEALGLGPKTKRAQPAGDEGVAVDDEGVPLIGRPVTPTHEAEVTKAVVWETPTKVSKAVVSEDAEVVSEDAEVVSETSSEEGDAARKPAVAQYKSLEESTPEDWVVQGAAFDKYAAEGHILRNVLQLVENMKGVRGEVGAIVDMYEHSLQTATRARRGGADTETIVCALLHDIGEVLSCTNHGEIPAALLRPYISPMNHWLLSQHEVFQAFFFLDKCGGDKDLRDKVQEYKDAGIEAGHPWYEACAKFCREYDQTAFDPGYDTDSMESFVPLVKEVLGRKPYWWEPEDKSEEELDCKARLCFGYSLDARPSDREQA